MRFKAWLFFLGLFALVLSQKLANAQNISNEGTEFWTVFPTHDPSGNNLATMNINVTSRNNSEVTVTCGRWSSGPVAIPANTVVTFLVDRNASYIGYDEGNMVLSDRAIRILVTPGRPKVVAYSHVFASARSAATLILPRESLGQKYYSMNYTQDNSSNSQNFLVLTAVEDNTRLHLYRGVGEPLVIDLPKAGDVYEYISTAKEDLTGTYVEVDPVTSSCKRFAAFSGSTSIIIGNCTGSRDPLLQQLYTINSWGKNYGLVPFMARRYLFRVLAQEDNTILKVDGRIVSNLSKGQYYESNVLTEAVMVSADKLISVAQYSLTQACSSVNGTNILGDPEMVLLNPTEFNIKNITVFSSDKQDIREKYINVFMKTDKTSTFRLNGTTLGNVWTRMAADTTYSYAQVQVYTESLTLSADDGFNAIAYGFGQAESYAYSAGTSLASSQFLTLVNKVTKTENTNACVGQATDFKLTMPYRLTKIVWRLGDGMPDFVDENPTPVMSTTRDGILYTYTSPVNKTFNVIGQQSIAAIASLETSGNTCITGELELSFTVDVYPIPNPDFSLSSTDVCLGSEVKPIDKSTNEGGSVSKWRWQFDNGPFVLVKNPVHIFNTPGNHTIKLWVGNNGDCWSATPKEITINIPPSRVFPKIAFQITQPVCVNDNVLQLSALETLGLPGIGVYMGKGVSETGSFDPAVAGVGVHDITYTFKSASGCENAVTQQIEVLALPVVTVPPLVYVLSGGQRRIEATAKGDKLTYRWSPSIGLDQDDVLDPVASPTKDTEYTLTVTVNGLCAVLAKVLVKVLDEVVPPNSFTPNGDGINDLWNIDALSSNQLVSVEVFNRNGQKVFSSKGYNQPFDGTFQRKPLPVGVYYYRINPNNGRRIQSGSLTIIR